MEANVPKENPIIPTDIIATSLTAQTSLGRQWQNFRVGSFQKVNKCMKGGNTRARAELARAPTNVKRSPRSGIVRARAATCKNAFCIKLCMCYIINNHLSSIVS